MRGIEKEKHILKETRFKRQKVSHREEKGR